MKLCRVLLAIWALAASQNAMAQNAEVNWDLVDGVAAIVGGRPVLLSDLASVVAMEEAKLKAKERAGLSAEAVAAEREKVRGRVLTALVENALLLFAGEDQCPSDSECGERMAGEVDKRVGQFLTSTKEDLGQRERFLRAKGLESVEQYRKSVREELLRQLYVGFELGKGTEISAQEAMAEMERRFGGKKARDEKCEGIRIREMGMEHVEFPLDPSAGLDAVLTRFEGAFRCYLSVQRGDIEIGDVEEVCGKDGEVRVSQTGIEEGMRLNETSSFAEAYKDVFDQSLEKGSGEFSEPFIIGKTIMMIRMIDVQYRCVTKETERAEIVESLMGRLAEQRQARRLEAVLDQLRSLYPVEIRAFAK